MYKAAILTEMMILWVSGLLAYKQGHSDKDWPTIFITIAPKSALSVAILLLILLVMADSGIPEIAALLGFLVTGTVILDLSNTISTGLASVLRQAGE